MKEIWKDVCEKFADRDKRDDQQYQLMTNNTNSFIKEVYNI